jgi:hypothetical protein
LQFEVSKIKVVNIVSFIGHLYNLKTNMTHNGSALAMWRHSLLVRPGTDDE